MTERLEQLKELARVFRDQTPSAPDWYRVIDHVVGTLLALEIERLEEKHNFERVIADTLPWGDPA